MHTSTNSPRSARAKRVLAAAVAGCGLLGLPACQIPPLRGATSATEVPAAFTGAAAAATTADSSARVGFKEFYGDPLLTQAIEQALGNNRELKVLDEEIQIAGNEVLARRGAYLPFVSGGGGGGFERTSRYTRNGSLEHNLDILPGRPFPDPLWNTRLGLDFDWQVDIWRQLRNARDAAAIRYVVAIERRNYFVTRLVAEVAANYYELLALDARLAVLNQTIQLQEQSLKVAEAKKDAGQGTELAVQRFQAEVRKNQSEISILKQDILETENRINFLANRFPQPIDRAAAGFTELTAAALGVGLPADLLQNRPDIRAAERELAAAGLDIKVARAQFYPKLTITAGLGYEAFNPRYLFNPEALAANVAGGLVAPLVNKKAIQADFMTANAKQLQALYDYQRTVVNAYTEVVNRVSGVENYRTAIDAKKQQMQALERSVEVATSLFQNARAEYVEVLLAQRDLLEARTALIEVKKQQLVAVVNAYQALGGGDALNRGTVAGIDPLTGAKCAPAAAVSAAAPQVVASPPPPAVTDLPHK